MTDVNIRRHVCPAEAIARYKALDLSGFHHMYGGLASARDLSEGKVVAIFDGEHAWGLNVSDEYRGAIIFCPWCGEELK